MAPPNVAVAQFAGTTTFRLKRAVRPRDDWALESLLASDKRSALQRLLDKAAEIKARDSSDPTFKAWKNTVEQTLVRIYGQPSTQVEQFNDLVFFYSPSCGHG